VVGQISPGMTPVTPLSLSLSPLPAALDTPVRARAAVQIEHAGSRTPDSGSCVRGVCRARPQQVSIDDHLVVHAAREPRSLGVAPRFPCSAVRRGRSESRARAGRQTRRGWCACSTTANASGPHLMLMNCVNSGWVLLSGSHRTRTRMAIRGRVRLAPERVVGWLGCLVDTNGWRLEEPKENAGV
jgi:hypothetical protein